MDEEKLREELELIRHTLARQADLLAKVLDRLPKNSPKES